MRKRTDKSFVANKGGFCLDRMGECYWGRRIEASEPNKPGGHRHASPNCIPGDPHSVRVRFDADGHSTNRRVPPSSTRLSRSPRLGDSGPSARCSIRNAHQIGEPHRSKLRAIEIREAGHHNQKRKIGASRDGRFSVAPRFPDRHRSGVRRHLVALRRSRLAYLSNANTDPLKSSSTVDRDSFRSDKLRKPQRHPLPQLRRLPPPHDARLLPGTRHRDRHHRERQRDQLQRLCDMRRRRLR